MSVLNDFEEGRPPLDQISTEELMNARLLFEAMLSFITNSEMPVGDETPKSEILEREIKEIDVELLSRDYQDD
jgi:hypothetical protein|tara:strand:+ start:448 stop:666 length:219 start_codon:yes stop_codon:yes gene_type:complete